MLSRNETPARKNPRRNLNELKKPFRSKQVSMYAAGYRMLVALHSPIVWVTSESDWHSWCCCCNLCAYTTGLWSALRPSGLIYKKTKH